VPKVICPRPVTAPDRWRDNFILAGNLLYEAGVTVIYYSEEDLWTTKPAPPAALDGSLENIIGQLGDLETNSTLTLWCAADLKDIKRTLVSIRSKVNLGA
jgi:hypothetical protein